MSTSSEIQPSGQKEKSSSSSKTHQEEICNESDSLSLDYRELEYGTSDEQIQPSDQFDVKIWLESKDIHQRVQHFSSVLNYLQISLQKLKKN